MATERELAEKFWKALGSDRTLLLRPNGGGHSIAVPMCSGDLIVQGGTCQRTFEHAFHSRPVVQRVHLVVSS